MEIFKNFKEFFFPSDMPEPSGSSAPSPEPPHTGIEEMQNTKEGGSNIVNIQATAQLHCSPAEHDSGRAQLLGPSTSALVGVRLS